MQSTHTEQRSFMNIRAWSKANLTLKETQNGVLVEQGQDSYLARHWTLSTDLIWIVDLAIAKGLPCLMQNRHPQASKRGAKGDGAVYLSFARNDCEYWVMAVNDHSSAIGRKPWGTINTVLINKQYRHALEEASVPHAIEPFRNASNIQVSIAHAEAALCACMKYVESHSPRKGRSGHRGIYPGFRDEADIERWLMENIDRGMLLGRSVEIVDRQVRIDSGSGIIDILLRDTATGGAIVLEVKQGRAQPEDVTSQLRRYVTSDCIRQRFGSINAVGCLVAEKIEHSVVQVVNSCDFPAVAFEIKWRAHGEVDINLVAGAWA